MTSKSQTGNILSGPASVSTTYDDDGNLTSDGLWNYTWDGENRLVIAETVVALPTTAQRKVEYDYDFERHLVGEKNTLIQDQAGFWMPLDLKFFFLTDGI